MRCNRQAFFRFNLFMNSASLWVIEHLILNIWVKGSSPWWSSVRWERTTCTSPTTIKRCITARALPFKIVNVRVEFRATADVMSRSSDGHSREEGAHRAITVSLWRIRLASHKQVRCDSNFRLKSCRDWSVMSIVPSFISLVWRWAPSFWHWRKRSSFP